MRTSAMPQTSASKLLTTQTQYLPVRTFLQDLTMYGYNNMDYQTLMQVIDDLNAIRTIEDRFDLIEKYENQACKIEADMVREMDWENEEVKHLFEMDDGA